MGVFAKLVAAQAELAIDRTCAAGNNAAVANPARAGIARQLVKLNPCSFTIFFGGLRTPDLLLKLKADFRIPGDNFLAPLVLHY